MHVEAERDDRREEEADELLTVVAGEDGAVHVKGSGSREKPGEGDKPPVEGEEGKADE